MTEPDLPFPDHGTPASGLKHQRVTLALLLICATLLAGCSTPCTIKAAKSHHDDEISFQVSASPGCEFFWEEKKGPTEAENAPTETTLIIRNLSDTNVEVFHSTEPDNHSHLEMRSILRPGKELEIKNGLRFIYSFRLIPENSASPQARVGLTVKFPTPANARRPAPIWHLAAGRPVDAL